MKNQQLLDTVTELGYQLAISGAETFRVEESINRVLAAYGIRSETFAIPNCLTISAYLPDGTCLTRVRRIGSHDNDLDSVEKYSNLSRKICSLVPPPEEAAAWLEDTKRSQLQYNLPIYLLGHFLGALGFTLFFGGNLLDCAISGICATLMGLFRRFLNRFQVNTFFSTMASAFVMALCAYGLGAVNQQQNTDLVIIGVLMILLPGLIFTNAMRDIIFGDTNSGMNRIVQVLIIAAAVAMGTGFAFNLSNALWDIPISNVTQTNGYLLQILGVLVGCYGFTFLFNIHGPGGLLCALGGALAWIAYLITYHFTHNELTAYFVSAIVAAAYSEAMARIRKYPAISYLVISIFPLIPGAGIYYTSNHLVLGNMDAFADKGLHTIGIAGAIAIGILLVSTLVRLFTVGLKHNKHK